MKTKTFFTLLIALLMGSSSLFAQGFKPPSPGKAVVYFCRYTKFGFAVSFEYFHNDKYIGIAKGQNVVRYECDPGQQLFWLSTENKEFVTADLQEGGTYLVIVNVLPGGMKGHVGCQPISASDERFEKVKDLIMKEVPVVTEQKKIDEMNNKLAKFIKENLDKYNNTWKNEKNFKNISSDMAVPESSMK
ncbi:MAG: hypothetical protein NTZ85_05760 [Bacteroidia bacterium]|jgi:hypothetical protein|nr:hypothetical protein [Bacteroidia bacterium]